MPRAQMPDEPPGPIAAAGRKLQSLYRYLQKENLPRLVLYVACLILAGGALVFLAEHRANRQMFTHLFDALWWIVVTVATVGYGDKYPVTLAGRILGMVVILMGVVAISTLSGTIASIFVERKMREDKGLQNVNAKNHTILCGWNRNGERILESLKRLSDAGRRVVVLVNEMDPEEFQALRSAHSDLDLRFVRGDFASEKFLRKAGVAGARSAILLSDCSGDRTQANADERTILATLAIKSLNPGINTSAELANPENEAHLRRANVDDILLSGEFNGFLLASATLAPSIPLVAKELLSFDSRSHLRQAPIPGGFVGRSFRELAEHFLRSGSGVLIGVLAEERRISLQDILSEGSPAIDAFIKQKFAEADADIVEGEKEDLQVRLNPGADYVIRANESAFLVGGSRADG
jgi:voltage-gated potassium channel